MANIIDSTRPEQVEIKTPEYPGLGQVEDSRLKGYNGKVTHPSQLMERTYCGNCGKPYGWVSQESSEMIALKQVVVYCTECEESLNKKVGPIPFRVIGGVETRDLKAAVDQIKEGGI